MEEIFKSIGPYMGVAFLAVFTLASVLYIMRMVFELVKVLKNNKDIVTTDTAQFHLNPDTMAIKSELKEIKTILQDFQRKAPEIQKACDRILGTNEAFYKMGRQVDELHKWHDQRDPDGAFKWFVKDSLTELIKNVNVNITTQTKVLEQLLFEQKSISKSVDELCNEVEKLKKER